MLPSYTLSKQLDSNINKAEDLRRSILTAIIPLKTEQRMVWEATIQRMSFGLKLDHADISRSEVIATLIKYSNIGIFSPKKNLSKKEIEILKRKAISDYILQNWLVTHKPISPKTVTNLFLQEHSIKHGQVTDLLEFVNEGKEHPFILSALSYLVFSEYASRNKIHESVCPYLAYIVLYKFGYDFRKLLVLEEGLVEDESMYQMNLNDAQKRNNATLWLEYFTEFIVMQLTKALKKLSSNKYDIALPSGFWELSDRQRAILSALDMPGSRMTNKIVQKLFQISQITASRELSHLVSLGLLTPRGKGRSIYYTKA